MKSIVIFIYIFLSTFLSAVAQNKEQLTPPNIFYSLEYTDSLNLWEYQFTPAKNSSDNMLGELILRRKFYITDSLKKDSILPQIMFTIYPVSKADSINKFESDMAILLSCCYPVCGATVIQTQNYVFWATPYSIKSAFNCSGIDYTRNNARRILNQVAIKNYNSLQELLKDLPVKKIRR